MKPEDAEAALKELIRAIPTDRKRVFAYPIKWDAFDAAAATLVPKLAGWVSKKITELLGVDEPTMARPSVFVHTCASQPSQQVLQAPGGIKAQRGAPLCSALVQRRTVARGPGVDHVGSRKLPAELQAELSVLALKTRSPVTTPGV